MPESEPVDKMRAMENVRKLPPGAYIKVYAVGLKRGVPWYRVKSIDRKKKPLGQGLINSIALIGQGSVDVQKQMQRQSALEKKLTQKYKEHIRRKHKLNQDQLSAIAAEGSEKNWPMPPGKD